MSLNRIQNIFTGELSGTLQGPIVASQVYDETSMTRLDIFEWEVFNGAKVPDPVPFGMFVSITQMNMSKSKIRVMLAPGFPKDPIFTEQTKEVKNYDKYLRNALLISKIVPIDFDIESVELTDFWDIQLEPVDESHAKLVKIYAASPGVQGYETNRDLFAPAGYTEEIVPAASVIAPSDGNTEYIPVDTYHTLKRVSTVPTAALTAFKLVFPSRIRVDLPKVLKSVDVVWNEQYSNGTQDTNAFDATSGVSGSISLSIPDSASSAAALTAELKIEFEEFETSNLFADVYIGYMPPPVNLTTLLAKLTEMASASVVKWPVFKPKSRTIVATGQSISLRANVQVSLNHSWSPTSNSFGRTSSVSDDYSIGLTNNAVQLPACIHPLVTFTGDMTKSRAVSATAAMALASSFGTSVSASKTKSGTASGAISPTSLAATSGQNTIPTSGLYLMDLDVAPYDYGWFKFRAEVFDASNFA